MPTSRAAEWSVIAHMLSRPDSIGEIIGVPLEQRDFSLPETRLIYATTVERHYSGKPVDALVIGELVRDELATYWNIPTNEGVGERLVQRVRDAQVVGNVVEQAALLKRLSASRQLQECCLHALTAINEGRLTPEEIGDNLSSEVLQVVAGSKKRSELLDWMDTGRAYAQHLQRTMKARQEGIEIGVYTGLPFIDSYTHGIGPGELCFLAGEPGVGKTAVAWAAALGFANRQLQRDPSLRVGTLMASLEMNVVGSTMRVIQNLTGVDGERLREGNITQQEYVHILREWKNRENLPMYFNFASNFRLSQLRALIAEAIRRANVGLIVIDHFRMVDTDRHYTNPNAEDEAKVRFLKENIAKDLNVAVICLAHTVKVGRGQGGESPKPRLSDLRGSGQVAAHADFVGFLWSPWKYMSDEARLEMGPGFDETTMELSWEKNRFGKSARAQLKFDAEKMQVTSR